MWITQEIFQCNTKFKSANSCQFASNICMHQWFLTTKTGNTGQFFIRTDPLKQQPKLSYLLWLFNPYSPCQDKDYPAELTITSIGQVVFCHLQSKACYWPHGRWLQACFSRGCFGTTAVISNHCYSKHEYILYIIYISLARFFSFCHCSILTTRKQENDMKTHHIQTKGIIIFCFLITTIKTDTKRHAQQMFHLSFFV